MFVWFFMFAQARLNNTFLSLEQANRLIVSITPPHAELNCVFEHVVYCHVVDRHRLREHFGVEGYYYCHLLVLAEREPDDNYEVIDHQRGFLF